MRKAFNFYRSYYEVAMELSDKDFCVFIKALLLKQFDGIEPLNLTGMANFAYLSQKHSIDSQILGYEAKTGLKLTPTEGGTQGGIEGGSVQEKEKGQEKGKGKEEEELSGYDDFLESVNLTLNKNFKGCSKSRRQFNTRIKEGYTKIEMLEAFENAIKDQYHIETNFRYITPEFITRQDKVEKFKN
jgi:hypothetical protein